MSCSAISSETSWTLSLWCAYLLSEDRSGLQRRLAAKQVILPMWKLRDSDVQTHKNKGAEAGARDWWVTICVYPSEWSEGTVAQVEFRFQKCPIGWPVFFYKHTVATWAWSTLLKVMYHWGYQYQSAYLWVVLCVFCFVVECEHASSAFTPVQRKEVSWTQGTLFRGTLNQ